MLQRGGKIWEVTINWSSSGISIGLGNSVRWASDRCSGVCWYDAGWVQQHSVMEIDYEIFSSVILSFLQTQEGQLSVFGEINVHKYWSTF